MKRLIVTLLAATIASVSLPPTLALSAVPPAVKFKAGNMGEVFFNHTEHQNFGTCAACHHKGVEAGACGSCHGKNAAISDMKKASHDLCKTCHRQQRGPTGCFECHIKEKA
jgi:Class III cytochrome C family